MSFYSTALASDYFHYRRKQMASQGPLDKVALEKQPLTEELLLLTTV